MRLHRSERHGGTVADLSEGREGHGCRGCRAIGDSTRGSTQCSQNAPAAPGKTTGLSKPSAETLATPNEKSSIATLASVSVPATPASRACVQAGSLVLRQ